eukprot:13612579-Alexandrium_andersonii.AAC.1
MEGQEETLSRRVRKRICGPRGNRSYPEVPEALGPEEPPDPALPEDDTVHSGEMAPNAPLTERQKEVVRKIHNNCGHPSKG